MTLGGPISWPCKGVWDVALCTIDPAHGTILQTLNSYTTCNTVLLVSCKGGGVASQMCCGLGVERSKSR
jgi:hypothetical protein